MGHNALNPTCLLLRVNTNPRTFGNVPQVFLERSSLGAMSLSPTLRATRKGATSRGTSRRLPRRFLSSLPVCEGAPSHSSSLFLLSPSQPEILSLYRVLLFVQWSSTPPFLFAWSSLCTQAMGLFIRCHIIAAFYFSRKSFFWERC